MHFGAPSFCLPQAQVPLCPLACSRTLDVLVGWLCLLRGGRAAGPSEKMEGDSKCQPGTDI